MTQKVYYFCNCCDKECLPKDGLGTFAGFIIRLDNELKPRQMAFEGHYCSECIEKILNFIASIKTDAEDTNPPKLDKSPIEGATDK